MSDYVLVVDDSPDIQAIVLDVLAEYGYQGKKADNGQQALEMVRADPPLAIVMGLAMPIMDGFTTIKHLNQDAHTQNIPIILLSALVNELPQDHDLPGVVGVMLKEEFEVDGFLGMLSHAE
jgi:two-component system alkaline phosphatase synthesis response regulator PhoP